MTRKARQGEAHQPEWHQLRLRLDAIIILLTRMVFKDEKGKMKMSDAVPFLYSVGFTPSEIGALLGKKRTELAQYIYKKQK